MDIWVVANCVSIWMISRRQKLKSWIQGDEYFPSEDWQGLWICAWWGLFHYGQDVCPSLLKRQEWDYLFSRWWHKVHKDALGANPPRVSENPFRYSEIIPGIPLVFSFFFYYVHSLSVVLHEAAVSGPPSHLKPLLLLWTWPSQLVPATQVAFILFSYNLSSFKSVSNKHTLTEPLCKQMLLCFSLLLGSY